MKFIKLLKEAKEFSFLEDSCFDVTNLFKNYRCDYYKWAIARIIARKNFIGVLTSDIDFFLDRLEVPKLSTLEERISWLILND